MPPGRRAVRPELPPEAERERARALLAELRRVALELERAWPGHAAMMLRALAKGIAEGVAHGARPRTRFGRAGMPGARHGKPTQDDVVSAFFDFCVMQGELGGTKPTVAGVARVLAARHGGTPQSWERKVRRGWARQAQGENMLAMLRTLVDRERNEP